MVLMLLALLIFDFLAPQWTYSAPPEYALASGDKLRVTVFGRPDLSGPFEIRASGSISLPLLGEVPATGLTLRGLEESIAERFSGVFTDPPFVNVEIETYRPFYVLGDVAEPGAYPYQHGMTVLRAIALAGGQRNGDADGFDSRADRQERERAQLLFQSYLADVAREARLIAERDGLTGIRFPEDLLNLRENPRIAEIIENEQSIFEIRRDTLAGKLETAKRERTHRLQLIVELRGTRMALAKKQRLVAQQFEEMEKGASRGVIPKLYLLRIQLSAAEEERQARQNAVSINREELAIIQVEHDLVEFQRQWEQDVATQLTAVQHQLSQSELQLRAFAGRVDVMQGARNTGLGKGEPKESVKFYMTRASAADSEEIEVRMDDWVSPGDVIRVLAPEYTFLLPRSPALQRLPSRITTTKEYLLENE